MPRKPKAVYAFIDPPPVHGSQVPGIQAWKLDIPEGQTVEDTLKANAHLFPSGHTVHTVTDTRAKSFSTQPALTPV